MSLQFSRPAVPQVIAPLMTHERSEEYVRYAHANVGGSPAAVFPSYFPGPHENPVLTSRIYGKYLKATLFALVQTFDISAPSSTSSVWHKTFRFIFGTKHTSSISKA